MTTRKICTILGARPQFIKAAVLSRIITQKKQLNERIIHTGQHYDFNMSQLFFKEMQIPQPAYQLTINESSHNLMIAKMLIELELILKKEKPDLVLVYGDTNSTLAGALAATKLQIPVAHVEAGLRSNNKKMPEEVNRIITDTISDILFCPTEVALQNLVNEGFNDKPTKIIQSGDIMKDAVTYYGELSASKSTILKKWKLNQFVLATIHRQENTDDPKKLSALIEGLELINNVIKVVLPLHPRTKKQLEKYNIHPQFLCIDPVGYFDMLQLLKECKMVATDSGGLQKEAFFNKKPALILREETEWTELIDYGYATLTGADATQIKKSFDAFCNQTFSFSENLYGVDSGTKIHDELVNFL